MINFVFLFFTDGGFQKLLELLNESIKMQNECIKIQKEVSSKIDVVLMNQGKLNHALLPHEKRTQRPDNSPNLPLSTVEELKVFEQFLKDDNNLSATVIFFFLGLIIFAAC